MKRKLLTAAAAVAILVVSAVLWAAFDRPSLPPLTTATYVGRDSCVVCHSEQAAAYRGSHHDLAMQIACEPTVVAKFDGQWQRENGQAARFFRRDDRYFVELQTGDGPVREHEIRWTFGVEPLQQYMIEIEPSATAENSTGETVDAATPAPTDIGRVQVLSWCWDTIHQRWFHLEPPDVHGPMQEDDPLHWLGSTQRWNTACAECHSTDLQKNFQLTAGRYATKFSEIDVSCEACHGPGSLHVRLAKESWWYRQDGQLGHALAKLKGDAESQIQACAPCHSRRTVVANGYRAGDNYHDHYELSLLTDPLYFADGQVRDEDYVYGSFIQSKMYHKGIKCSDCHDPHSARLKHEGNAVCTSCHQHPATKYDTPAHHFHASGTAGAACVNCHMPATTYMEVDSRRDHSFRIPRPDLSRQLGTPNACTGCHLPLELKKLPDAQRADLLAAAASHVGVEADSVSPDAMPVTGIDPSSAGEQIQYRDFLELAAAGNQPIGDLLSRIDGEMDAACDRFYGEVRQRPPHFATALAAGRRGDATAVGQLKALIAGRGETAPAIARATALVELSQIDPTAAIGSAIAAVDDPSPLVRRAAAEIAAMPVDERTVAGAQSVLRQLLGDAVRSVRVAAANAAINLPVSLLNTPAGRRALEELKARYAHDLDSAGGHLSLGIVQSRLGNIGAAIDHYEDAIRIDGSVVGPRSNLAELLGTVAENQTGPQRESLRQRADQLRREELPLMVRDYELSGQNAALAYRLGCAYYLVDDRENAEKYLTLACEADPSQLQFGLMLIMLLREDGQDDAADKWLNKFLQRYPNDLQLRQLQSAGKTNSR